MEQLCTNVHLPKQSHPECSEYTYPCKYFSPRNCSDEPCSRPQDSPFFFPPVNPDCGLKIKAPIKKLVYPKTCNGY